MKRSIFIAISISILVGSIPANAAVKAGTSCKAEGSISVMGKKTFTCIKSGKKLVWDKGSIVALSPMPSQTSTESKVVVPNINLPIPTSFQDLYQNRSGIAYGAWLKTSTVMKDSKAQLPPLEVFIGPQTTPWNGNVEEMMSLVSKSFPNAKLPSRVVAYFYNFKDLEWAVTQVRQKLNSRDYSDLSRNEGGRLVESNCQAETQDCMGAKQQTTTSGSDIALLLIGVTNHPGMYSANDRSYGDPGLAESSQNGLLLAHEYFHSLQREQMIGKPLQQVDWPPSWVREGSASFVQDATVYSNSFSKYYLWRDLFMKNTNNKKIFDEKTISDYMNLDNYADNWNKYNPDWAYLLGFRISEVLVSLKGPESIIDFYTQMSHGIGFQAAFKNVYGIEYSEAIPIISKTVSANFASQ